MKNEKNNLPDRFLDFATQIIKLALRLNKTSVGRHAGNQLVHAGTSAGANYEEACGAESRTDFSHKLQVVLKELKESILGLKLIKKSELLPSDYKELLFLIRKSKELSNIIGKSVVTTKTIR